MPAVETLGSTTVICSDKTGTLTENQMTVRAIWTPSGAFEVTGSGYQPDGTILDETGAPVDVASDEALRWTLFVGAACNDARLSTTDGTWDVIGDPTEGAMLVAAGKAGINAATERQRFPRSAAVPFSSERKYMATLHADGENARIVCAKGAVERILDLCASQMCADGSRAALDRARVLSAAEALARQGLRVLAAATASIEPGGPFGAETLAGTLTFTGLHAMADPPRAAAISAVRACHSAGIDVKMITGDHASTAAAIAQELGILTADDPSAVLTGADLADLDPSAFAETVARTAVFARVSPEQKLRLVEALQGREHVVAMTGDGVNDAPALQQANIGVAMGKGGTEIAKEAADMILVDDDFATIEAAVEEGRGVFDNLTKFITWTLPTNIGEGFVILVAIVVGATLPILPVQILWINMTTAVALGLMLAFEPKEDDIMLRPPRDPRRPLLTGTLLFRIALVSSLLVAGAWWLFEWEQSNGASVAEARTAAVNVFVVVEAFYLFNCRSLTQSMWHVGMFSNRWILGGVTVQAIGQLAITYIPAMNSMFHTAPIDAAAWLRIFALALLASIVVGTDKWLRRRAGTIAAQQRQTISASR
jgi:cation-transporting ATPase F